MWPKGCIYIIDHASGVTNCIHKFEQVNCKDFNCFQLGTRLYINQVAMHDTTHQIDILIYSKLR
jgi:hypothetical protein